jgi:hypothetical protein
LTFTQSNLKLISKHKLNESPHDYHDPTFQLATKVGARKKIEPNRGQGMTSLKTHSQGERGVQATCKESSQLPNALQSLWEL